MHFRVVVHVAGGGAGRTQNLRRGRKLFVVFNSNFDFIVSKSSFDKTSVKSEWRQRLMNNMCKAREIVLNPAPSTHVLRGFCWTFRLWKFQGQNLRVPKSTKSNLTRTWVSALAQRLREKVPELVDKGPPTTSQVWVFKMPFTLALVAVCFGDSLAKA